MEQIKKMENILNRFYKESQIRYKAYLREVKDLGYKVFVDKNGKHRVIEIKEKNNVVVC